MPNRNETAYWNPFRGNKQTQTESGDYESPFGNAFKRQADIAGVEGRGKVKLAGIEATKNKRENAVRAALTAYQIYQFISRTEERKKKIADYAEARGYKQESQSFLDALKGRRFTKDGRTFSSEDIEARSLYDNIDVSKLLGVK